MSDERKEEGRRRGIHYVKCRPEHFERVGAGEKPFEVRVNDRSYEAGDFLVLHEWDPTIVAGGGREADGYTGREIRGVITCVYGNAESRGISDGYVVLGCRWTVGVFPRAEGS